ncbi:hypothetical protein ABZW47_07695 [Streptomyces sp. NPDC004549]|uniref:hypothetical protein n=1 Tax=Streptomyces sp. NPDC004549 TaxID=3154283 RepID=UPI0033B92724
MSTNDMIPCHGSEEASPAAYVKITTTRIGPDFTASVPAREAGRMLETSHLAFGICGAVIGPPIMAKAIHAANPDMPWQMTAALLALAALLPVACYAVATRRRS